jgi:pilus assembly protein CpaE
MKLSPDLHDDDLDGPDATEAFGPVDAYWPEAANETDGAGAFELAGDSHEQSERPEPHVLADRVHEAFSPDDHGAEMSVPRIVIHGFFERQDTADVLTQAAGDRRMARATTELLPGGLTAAVAHYQNHPTPSLVVVRSAAPPAQLLPSSRRWPTCATPAPRCWSWARRTTSPSTAN